jgi:hypothetical protein
MLQKRNPLAALNDNLFPLTIRGAFAFGGKETRDIFVSAKRRRMTLQRTRDFVIRFAQPFGKGGAVVRDEIKRLSRKREQERIGKSQRQFPIIDQSVKAHDERWRSLINSAVFADNNQFIRRFKFLDARETTSRFRRARFDEFQLVISGLVFQPSTAATTEPAIRVVENEKFLHGEFGFYRRTAPTHQCINPRLV